MPVTHLAAPKARIDVTLDGVTITRSRSEAARRGTAQHLHVAWDDVTGAEVSTTRKGRPVVRLGVLGMPTGLRHRDDPHAIKVPRSAHDTAHLLVERINQEVAVRRRWQQHAEGLS